MPDIIDKCPRCGSHDLEKLVFRSRRIQWEPLPQDPEDCMFVKDCERARSWRCQFCHRKYTTVRQFYNRELRKTWTDTDSSENWCQFKDKEYYRETVPFIEVHWLFEQEREA